MQSDNISLITHLENMALIMSSELRGSLVKLDTPLCLFCMFKK